MANQPGEPNEVSNFKLKASYWYVMHKLQLRKALIIFLIVLSVALYSYSFYRAMDILVMQDRSYRQDLNSLSSNLIDYSYFQQANKPKDLEILGFDLAGGVQSRYDFIAQVNNPNPQYSAIAVKLQLVSADQVIAEKDTFFMPGEKKYVVFFGQEVSDPNNAVIKVSAVSWHREHDFENFSASHLRFETADINFTAAGNSGIRGDLPVSVLSFKITNASGYSFWRVGVNMVLLNGDKVVGANYTTLDQFKAGETRNMEMRWYESLPSVTSVQILPEVNILSAASYMPVQ